MIHFETGTSHYSIGHRISPFQSKLSQLWPPSLAPLCSGIASPRRFARLYKYPPSLSSPPTSSFSFFSPLHLGLSKAVCPFRLPTLGSQPPLLVLAHTVSSSFPNCVSPTPRSFALLFYQVSLVGLFTSHLHNMAAVSTQLVAHPVSRALPAPSRSLPVL